MSSKNKKRLLRKIIIDNYLYYWFVGDADCDGDGGLRFKIWKDRKLIYEDLIHSKTITPSVVKEIILNKIK